MHQYPPPNEFNHPSLTDSEQTQTHTDTGAGTVVVPIPPGSELLALQIQAFLRASQDEELDGNVEIDEEIVNDILGVLSDSGLGSSDDSESVDGQVGVMKDDDDELDGTGDLRRLTSESKKGSRDILEGQSDYYYFPSSFSLNLSEC